MARLHDRGGRDAAGFGPYHRPDADLVPLRELKDWKLSRGEPDIRGWEVRTVSGRALGTVRELLVDRHSREVVLMDLDLIGGERRARAPIRAVQIDREARVIRMDSADILGGEAAMAAQAASIPSDRVVERTVATDADLARGDTAERVDHTTASADDIALGDTSENRDRQGDAERDRLERRPDDMTSARRTAEERLADGGIDERVVERRPVVYEEVVVRRRNADADASNVTRDATGRDVTPNSVRHDIPPDERR